MRTHRLLWLLSLLVVLALVAAQCSVTLSEEEPPASTEAESTEGAVFPAQEEVFVEEELAEAASDEAVFASVPSNEFAEEEADLEVVGVTSREDELADTKAGEFEVVESEAIGLALEEGAGTEQLAHTEDMRVLFEEMTFVQVMSEEYARIEAACAGVGLNNINPSPDGPMILIPNAGDLAVNGANVAIQLDPDGDMTFIPRVQGQRINLPMEVGDKATGDEVTSLTLDEAMQLMAAGKLEWTAKGHGLDGTGHGLPGHIADCDPRYEDS
jgi:hypothetical protein